MHQSRVLPGIALACFLLRATAAELGENMRAVLLWVLVAAPVFASGMSVCEEWQWVDAGMVEQADAGPSSVYQAPIRRCVRYGFKSYGEPGCSSVQGESLLLLALLVARWRR